MNDYEIGLMQTLMPLCLIVKLNHDLNQNQRFKKDKSGQQIIRGIIPLKKMSKSGILWVGQLKSTLRNLHTN